MATSTSALRSVLLCLLAPASGLAPATGLQTSHGACRRASHLVAQQPNRLGCATRWNRGLEQQLQRYQAVLEAAPMRTQMTTAALLAGLGDAIAQRIEGRGAFVWRRFAREAS